MNTCMKIRPRVLNSLPKILAETSPIARWMEVAVVPFEIEQGNESQSD